MCKMLGVACAALALSVSLTYFAPARAEAVSVASVTVPLAANPAISAHLVVNGTSDDEAVFLSITGSPRRDWQVNVVAPLLAVFPIEAGLNCDPTLPAVSVTICNRGISADNRASVDLKAGNDSFHSFDPTGAAADLSDPVNVLGGNGKDFMKGGSAGDTLNGGTSDDRLIGGLGADSLQGGTGADELTGDDPSLRFVDPDRINGGTGVDSVSYSNRRLPLRLSLDARANDGQRNGLEGDNLINLEKVVGGGVNDRIIGNSATNFLFGLAGRDVIAGRDGGDLLEGGTEGDTLQGETGDDRLVGGDGDDLLVGGDDADVLEGNNDRDTLVGGSGQDFFTAGPGDDVIFAADGVAEVIRCGTGNDSFQADVSDVRVGCETPLPPDVQPPA